MLGVQNHLFTTGAFVAQLPGYVPARDLESAVTTMNDACFGPGAFDAALCALTSGDVGRLRMQNVCATGHVHPAAALPSPAAVLAAVTAPAAARVSANTSMLQALAVIGSTPSLAATDLPCGRATVLASTAPMYLAAAYPGNGLFGPVPTSPFVPPMQHAAQLFSLSL